MSQLLCTCLLHCVQIILYIGELCRYLLAQPQCPQDRQHCVRLAMGNGLKEQIWDQYKKQFGIEKIFEFYGSMEGNASMGNTAGKTGACGFVPLMYLVCKIYPLVIVKVNILRETTFATARVLCAH